jgi:hypothetical protein
MAKKYIEVPILNNQWKAIVCWGKPSEVIKVLKAWGYPKDEFQANCFDRNRGVCFMNPDCHPVIALPRKPRTAEEYGTLAHEAVHAVESIFESINQPIGDELFAHSVGAIVRETLKQKHLLK